MKNRELVHMRARILAAYESALQTPELFADEEAARKVRDKLAGAVQPLRPEQKALPTLVSESE